MFNQKTLQLDHAHRQLEKCRDREARAARLYHKRIRETEKAATRCRHLQRRATQAQAEAAINASLSLWDGRSQAGG